MNTHDLKPHPKNEEIYGDIKLDDDFLQSVKDKGIMVPLAVKKDGTIISGHRRYKAAKTLGIKDVQVGIAEFDTKEDEILTLIHFNKQREKTFSQKMNEAEEIERIEKKKAKERMSEGAAENNKVRNNSGSEKFHTPNTGRSNDKVASKIGMGSGRTYSKGKKIWDKAKGGDEDAQQLVKDIDSGKKSISGAEKEIRRAEKKKQREKKRKKISENNQQLEQEEKKYRVVYADPPWEYNDKQDIDTLGGAQKHYPTMNLTELSTMPINDISEDDAVLFLWTTSPLLEDAFDVVNNWGFTYKTSFVWDKVGHNMGHYNSVRHEFLLVCTKGSCTPDKKKLFDSVQSIEKTKKHSEKPEEFREIIDTLYTHGNKIELFRRGTAPDGWDVFGNEVNNE